MKYPRLATALASALIFALLSSGLLPIAAQDPKGPAAQVGQYFYYYNGDKVALELSTDWIAVKYQGDALLASQSAAAASPNISAELPLRETGTPNIALLPLKAGGGEQAALQAIADLRANSAFEWVNPVFEVQQGLAIPTQQFIAQFPATATPQARASFNQANSVTVVRQLDGLPGTYVLEVAPSTGKTALEMANFYHESGMVVYAEPNFLQLLQQLFVPNDTLFGSQWHLRNTGQFTGAIPGADIAAVDAWNVSQGSNSIIIAVVDDGVDLVHPDLAGQFVPGYDFANNDNDPSPAQSWHAHGTGVAGLIAARTNNSLGVAGVCPNCRIMPIKLSNPNPDGSFSVTVTQVVDSFNFAASNGASVINNSWGGGAPNTTVENVINNITVNGRSGKGVVMLASAGNGNTSPIIYPARYNRVISVGASNWCDLRKAPSGTPCDASQNWGSHYGFDLDISAPGMRTLSTDIAGSWGYESGDYTYFGGTSAASPITAGVVGLMLSVNNNLTADQVRRILRMSADDMTPDANPGWDQFTGAGRVNAYRALHMSQNVPLHIEMTNDLTTTAVSISPALKLYRNAQEVLDSTSSGDPTASCATYVNSVWYTYRPHSNRSVTISTLGSTYDTVLAVYTNPASGTSEVACNDDFGGSLQSQVTFSANADVTYWIMVGRWGSTPLTARQTLHLTLRHNANLFHGIGVFRPSQGVFYLRHNLTAGPADLSVFWGGPNDYPVAGDWDGDGTFTVGFYRSSTGMFYLTNANVTGAPIAHQFSLGVPGDLPMAGDWNGDGRFGVGTYRPSNGILYLRNTLTTGFADFGMIFGIAGDMPVAGDWDGDGIYSPGIYRPSQATFFLTQRVTNGAIFADLMFLYGSPGDVPLAGDWNFNGKYGIGVFRPTTGTTLLRNELSAGSANFALNYGIANDRPIAGYWRTAASADLGPEAAPTFVPRQ
ncbi:MAG: S8 family serine peptidase [Aggregatilineales bacterium]